MHWMVHISFLNANKRNELAVIFAHNISSKYYYFKTYCMWNGRVFAYSCLKAFSTYFIIQFNEVCSIQNINNFHILSLDRHQLFKGEALKLNFYFSSYRTKKGSPKFFWSILRDEVTFDSVQRNRLETSCFVLCYRSKKAKKIKIS